MKTIKHALEKSGLNFIRAKGKSLEERYREVHDWAENRKKNGVWNMFRTSISRLGDYISMADGDGLSYAQYLNFGTQDYLGLSQDTRILDAARQVIDDIGIHSAGSAPLNGRTTLVMQLEEKLERVLGMEHCTVYPTGWMAGYGAVAALVRPSDTVIVDQYSHNCLMVGAQKSTRNFFRFRHNDLNHLEELLRSARESDSRNGLFVVLESLYSMDADSPKLNKVLQLIEKYEAIMIMDMAHDFAAGGKHGLGLLETVDLKGRQDVVVLGSFSKSFATNGGFVAGPKVIQHALGGYSDGYTFTSATSPLQAKIAYASAEIIFSEEGDRKREQLLSNIIFLREEMQNRDLITMGKPAPFIPLMVGNDRLTRLMSKHISERNLLVNIVEFPAVPRHTARFRVQLMSSHSRYALRETAAILAESKLAAEIELAEIDKKNTIIIERT